MTFAWQGHLRFETKPLTLVILENSGIAFFEYCLAIPANRIGHQVYAGAELKTMREVINLLVFAVFCVWFLGERLTINHFVGFSLIFAGAVFTFRGPLQHSKDNPMTSSKGDQPVSIIVMGPSGVGKTTAAQLLCERLGWPFAEGDEFHPPENIEKMSAGIPLEDADRAPWLAILRDWISGKARDGVDTVLTCSALKRSYRDTLREADARVVFLELVANQDLVAERLSHRKGHYMPATLLASQFAALEELDADEDGVKISVDASPQEITERAIAALGLSHRL